jgi:organic radical activating enzyme
MEKKKSNLVISEKFYSMQGEGQTIGVPAIFIRLAACNILCKSESWICDSIEVWKKGTKTEFENVLSDYEISLLRRGAHLIWTGGEPLLHMKKINEYLDYLWLNEMFRPTMEIETNGTLPINDTLFRQLDYINCSPKLHNSGVEFEKRVNLDVISQINEHQNSIFKFVISNKSDLDEIHQDYGGIIDHKKIVLMPAGETQEKLNETRPKVVEAALEHGYRYSDRLHIIIWNQKTGV